MSEEQDVPADVATETQNAPSGPTPVPPQDLALNLDLYNYDSPDAQSCPYVLTSPRSLEACSRIGIKPVDLLHKSLAEFSDDVEQNKPLEEIVKLYDEHEQQRIILLQKCQAEREFLIWRSTSKRRSHSLSPCRRNRIYKQQKSKESPSNRGSLSQSFRLAQRRKSNDDLLSASDVHEAPGNLQRSRSSSVKNLHRSGQRPTSWSTPCSPYYQGSRNLFVRITSPVVCAKLQTFPNAKMRLPPKDMKILEVILQKYEKLEEDEERRARAQRRWDREKEDREKKKEEAEFERWKNLALKQKRSSSEERLKISSEKSTPTHCCSRYAASEKDSSEKSSVFQKRHSFKQAAKNQTKSFDEHQNPRRNFASDRMSRYEAEQKLKAIQLKQEQVRRRRMEIIQKRDDCLKRSAEDFKVKLKQVKMNQQELDKAMEKWQEQVICYQDSANMRAAEKAAEIFEQKRLRAMQGRVSKQEEHKRNMQKIEAEDYAKLQEMMAKLRSKDERCRAFKEEKDSSMEQSRQLAQAASDLRDLIRQRLDKDAFVRKSQQAALESRLLSIEPRNTKNQQLNPDEEK